ncbi:hypothetical protein B0J14DRAFT_706988 [Halenospora varia]|nr:hypothetical protein B0J14DRAFT_706988 [Halenospora varia]
MSVEIKIFHVRETHVFRGGDELSGFLELWGPVDHDQLTIEVTFCGESNTIQPVKQRTLEDKAKFFDYSQLLFAGKVSIERGAVQQYPFKFQIPLETEPGDGNSKVKYFNSRGKEKFLRVPHLLPPSCAFRGTFINREYAASVSYTLRAAVVNKVFVRRATGTITIVHPALAISEEKIPADAPALVAVSSKVFTSSTSRLLPDKSQRRRSVGGWLGDTFKSGTPKAVFQIVARTTQVLTTGQDIPIQLKVEYDAEKSNLASPAEVKLTQMKYKVKALTDVVSRGFLTPDMHVNARETVYKRTLNFASMPLTHNDGEESDIGIWNLEEGRLSHIRFEKALVTPFNSYNVCRRYELEMIITFECGGKQSTTTFLWTPLEIIYNEGYVELASKQFTVEDNPMEGAAVLIKVLAGTALVLAAVLGS